MTDESRDEAEKRLIASLLIDPAGSAMQAIELGVKSWWFANDDYAALFEAAYRATTQNRIEELDALSLAEEARKLDVDEKWKRPLPALTSDGWSIWYTQVIDAAPTAQHVIHHINQLRTHVFQRELSKTFQKSMKLFLADPIEATVRLTDAVSEAYMALMGDMTTSKSAICIGLEEAERQSWHMRVDPEGPKDLDWVPGLRTPWPELTRLYLGIGPRFHIIAARPSVGKTSIAVNFARYWADRGVKVLFNSLDMPPEDMIDRLRTEKSRISISKKRYTPTAENLQKLAEASEWVCKSTVEVTESLYVEDFCVEVAMKAKSGKADVVVVDYVQLLQSHKADNENEYERVSYAAEYLKRTANKAKIPIIALCQLNRASGTKGGDNAEPTLTDLRGSGALEQAASTVLLLHRDAEVVKTWGKETPPWWYYENESYGRKKWAAGIDPIWAILAKNQNGPTGRLPFVVNKPYFVWKLGDEKAQPYENEEGHGATARTTYDNRPKFERIHRDWRKDSWEESLEVKRLPYSVDGRCGVPVLLEEEEEEEDA